MPAVLKGRLSVFNCREKPIYLLEVLPPVGEFERAAFSRLCDWRDDFTVYVRSINPAVPLEICGKYGMTRVQVISLHLTIDELRQTMAKLAIERLAAEHTATTENALGGDSVTFRLMARQAA